MKRVKHQIPEELSHEHILQHYNFVYLIHRRELFPGLEKVGNLVSSFPWNLTIWREIMTFHIKKYIRHSGKFVGNVNFFPGNLHFFKPWLFQFYLEQLLLNYNLFPTTIVYNGPSLIQIPDGTIRDIKQRPVSSDHFM